MASPSLRHLCLLESLGARAFRGGTLLDAVARDPQLLRTWAASRVRAPQGQELRIFAKLMMATLEATEIVDVGSLSQPRSAASSPQPTRGFTEPVTATRIHQRAVIAMSGPINGGQLTVANHLKALVAWAPHVFGFLALCLAWCVLSRPELIAIVPVKLAGWIPLYLAWAGNRILSRLEQEFHSWFLNTAPSTFALPAPETATATGMPGTPYGQHAPSSGIFGWLIAAYLACKHQ